MRGSRLLNDNIEKKNVIQAYRGRDFELIKKA